MLNSKLTKGVKRDPSLPKGRQADDLSEKEIKELVGNLHFDRSQLIEALHLIQDKFNCLSQRHLKSLSELFKLSQAEVFEVASFYHHFDIVKDGESLDHDLTIRICDGLSCEMAGAQHLIKNVKEIIDENKIRIQKVPCIGRCANAPAAQVGKKAVNNATPLKLLKFSKDDTAPEIPDYQNLSDYIKIGGYECLKKVISKKLNLENAISILAKSGLRGLGGAGFPADKKWQIVNSYNGIRYMTINGDEGEPGTFKDRFCLESEPHKMLEGAKIAYETIITEFSKGELKNIKNLLDKKVFKTFEDALSSRKKEGHKSETTFIGINSAEIKKHEKNGNLLEVTVEFVSEIISCVKDKEAKIIAGDPSKVKKVHDTWKFSKNIMSNDPNWSLVETNI